MFSLQLALISMIVALAAVQGFLLSSSVKTRSSSLSMAPNPGTGGGVGFKYDPSNYKDSNSGNYRRLTDQLAAVKAEEEELAKEREELIRKEQMQKLLLKQENETFWNTPDSKIMGSADKYFIPPEVLQIIDDLDNQLIGLQPVS
jgi:hypothetical protein